MEKLSQFGRSMVEMLGVLAIIGVLSIGALAGYTYAMNRYKANEIIDTMSKLATIAMSKEPVYEHTLTRAPQLILVSYADLEDLGFQGQKVAGMITTMEAKYYPDDPGVVNIAIIRDEVPVDIMKLVKSITGFSVFMSTDAYRVEYLVEG